MNFESSAPVPVGEAGTGAAGRSGDIDDAFALYRFLANTEPDGSERLIFCIIPGTPPSKARVRFGRHNTYNRPEAVAAERRTAVYVQRSLRGYRFPGNVALGCIFYRSTQQRVDADNMLKHVCDAINGIAFDDDSQVTAIAARVELDADNPRTVVVLGPHTSTMLRGVNDTMPCRRCGAPIYRRQRGRRPKAWCSQDCWNASRRVNLSEPVACSHCGQPFKRTTTAQKLCSAECRVASRRGKQKNARQHSNCVTCGKQLTHNRGGRCRDCWRANPRVYRTDVEDAS